MRGPSLPATVAIFALLPRLYAPPPLITGDVPTADRGNFELYTGIRYQDTGSIERQLLHVELVYGLTDRWKASVESNYLSRAGEHGLDDVTLATKVVLLPETATLPSVGVSYENKFDSGDAARGLGSGGAEHDFRLRGQKAIGRVLTIANVGYVLVSDVKINGQRGPRQNAWRASLAQEWAVGTKMKLLGELYWRSADEPGAAARLGWNVGFKHKLYDALAVHGALGESLRAGVRIFAYTPASNTSSPDHEVRMRASRRRSLVPRDSKKIAAHRSCVGTPGRDYARGRSASE